MKQRTIIYAVLGIVGIGLAGALYAYDQLSVKETTVSELSRETHFHGIAVDAINPRRLYLATHHGLFAVTLDGKAGRLSDTRDDFMGFTAHPIDQSALYASGHPTGGGNLGFIASRDGGRSWIRRSNGAGGPADFHLMDVSKTDPKIVYGVFGDLQLTTNGGRTWMRIGPVPPGITALAASSQDINILYAATQSGLQRSHSGGRSWKLESNHPTTMVHVTRDSRVYAYMVGIGLVKAAENEFAWQIVGQGFGEDHIQYFATDAVDYRRLYAITTNPRTQTQRVIASTDGGASWKALGGM